MWAYVYACRRRRSTARSEVGRLHWLWDAGELRTVLPCRPGGRGSDRALDAAGAARAADGEHALQRAAARGAADVLVTAQQTAEGAGALEPDHPRAVAGRARQLLRADSGRRSAGAPRRRPRNLEPGMAEAGSQRRGGRPGTADVGHAAQPPPRPPAG